jgi:glycine/D-amino acid oxidase-like deaminating enzyme
MQTDVLIIGQGICGTMLSWWLERAGMSYFVIDEPLAGSASRVASGVINPVTGRRIVKTWMIEDLMPFALTVYEDMGKAFDRRFITQKNTIDFFPTPQMRNAYRQRYEEDQEYLLPLSDAVDWNAFFHYDFGFGEINPCYLVDLKELLASFRTRLIDQGRLAEERFNTGNLRTEEYNIQYQDIQCQYLVFCDGAGGRTNPYFKDLPFAPNKGEALLVEIRGLPAAKIFKKGINLVPVSTDLFWVGSSYEWEFADEKPSAAFLEKMTAVLKEWLKMPFRITDHLSSVRPATLERRPFVGMHPLHSRIGILNGMGTKGCSLAPYFARQLSVHLADHAAIDPQADVRRFSGILTRSASGKNAGGQP